MYTEIGDTMFRINVATPNEMLSADFLPKVRIFLRLQFAIVIIYWFTLWSVKGAMLLWIYRAFKFVDLAGSGRPLYIVLCVIVGATFCGCIVWQPFSCDPPASYFHPGTSGCSHPFVRFSFLTSLGACETGHDLRVSNGNLYYSFATDIVTDSLIVTFIAYHYKPLHLTTRQKFLLYAPFSLEALVVAFAVVRVVKLSPHHTHVDPVSLAFWSTIEATSGRLFSARSVRTNVKLSDV
jgi:hypothetical protein